MTAGKGSAKRPSQINKEQIDANWEATFGKKKEVTFIDYQVQLEYIVAESAKAYVIHMDKLEGYVPGKTKLTVIVNEGVELLYDKDCNGLSILGGIKGDEVHVINNGKIVFLNSMQSAMNSIGSWFTNKVGLTTNVTGNSEFLGRVEKITTREAMQNESDDVQLLFQKAAKDEKFTDSEYLIASDYFRAGYNVGLSKQ